MGQRVLQIVDSLQMSDTSSAMYTVSRAIATHGRPVSVLSLGGDGALGMPLRRAGVEVRSIDSRIRSLGQLAWQVRRAISVLQPDIVHAWTEKANLIVRLATIRSSVPRLITSHRTIPRRPSFLTEAMDRSIGRRGACTVNSRTALAFYGKGSKQANPPRLLVDGVPVRRPLSPELRADIRAQFGLSPDAKLVGAVGPLVSEKRIKDAIWAVDLLRFFYRELCLLVIGEGPDRWRLERYSRLVQDRGRTVFLGDRADQLDLIGALDCLCQAGKRESMPGAVLEAMAVGVPVVASDVAGHRELITPELTGILVPIGHRGSLARSVYRVLSEPPLAQRLSLAAMNFVREGHGVDTMVEGYRELYCEAI